MGTFLNRLIGVTAVCALVAAAAVASAQRGPQQVEVLVLDRDDNPVKGLTVADFVVREDGQAREIAAVEPAPPPSPIVLLVDNSQAADPAIADLRKGLTGFIAGLTGPDSPVRVGLWTFGERPTKITDPTVGGAAQRGVDSLFHRPNTGAHLLEAIGDVTRDLVKLGAVRPAIVAFVAESGPEFSQEDRPRVAQALQRAGATLWAVVLQAPAGGLVTTTENRERAAVIGDGTGDSGGLTIRVLSPQGIPGAFDRLQRLFTARTRISYGRPEKLIPPKTLEITTRREGLKVVAPEWAVGR